jgi:hypothetical protein
MSKSLLAALAATAIFLGAPLAARAASTTLAAPSMLRAAGAPAHLVLPIAILCGMNGCAPVHVARVRRPPRNFTSLAAPLVVPTANAPLIPATTNK